MNKNLEKILKGIGITASVSASIGAGSLLFSYMIIGYENKTLNPAKIIQNAKRFNPEEYEKNYTEQIRKTYCFARYK